MLKRLWLVLSVLWAGLFFYNASTKRDGMQQADVMMALLPPAIVLVLGRAAGWVVRGR
jgi:hypothetical protein